MSSSADGGWLIRETIFDPERMGFYEALFTLGNGYVGTRGAFEERYLQRTPGVFVAGLYDQLPAEVSELPNVADWVRVEIYLDGARFDLLTGEILDYARVLDMQQGLLTRQVRWQSPAGSVTQLSFQRVVALHDKHNMGLSIRVTPENWRGEVRMTSYLDGQVTNSGAQHFIPREGRVFGERGIYLLQETFERCTLLGVAANHVTKGLVQSETFSNGRRQMAYQVAFAADPEQPCGLDKLVTIIGSHEPGFVESEVPADPIAYLRGALCRAGTRAAEDGWRQLVAAHASCWTTHWERADIVIEGDAAAQRAVRFAIFHLIQAAPWHDARLGIGAKGLSGEGYSGHSFWDTELFMLPFFIYAFPAEARNLLFHRYHILPGALQKAAQHGYAGAMFPWETDDTGRELTAPFGQLDAKTRQPIKLWMGDLQLHIVADIAFAVWHYYQMTGDADFLADYGAELLCLGARFWYSRAEYARARDVYELKNVIGPDEYTEFVDNDFYTNTMAGRHLQTAVAVCRLLQAWGKFDALAARIDLAEREMTQWLEMSRKLKVTQTADGVFRKCDGFQDLADIDVAHYRGLPGSLANYLDFFGEINKSRVLKQADVLHVLVLLDDEFTPAEKRANWAYYEPLTVHKSSLSYAPHAILAADIGLKDKAYEFFLLAAGTDLDDGLSNTAGGLHAAALGGLWQVVVNGFGGVRVRNGRLALVPALPANWTRLRFKLHFQGADLLLTINRAQITIQRLDGDTGTIQIVVGDEEIAVSGHDEVKRPYSPPRP